MYWRGHVGAALLAVAPLGTGLSAAGEPLLAAFGTAVAVAVATLPDADERLPLTHRGTTHTVWFVAGGSALSAVAGGAAGVAIGRPLAVAAVIGLAAALSLASHLLADSVTPMGVRPFVPLSPWHHSFDVTPARNPRANRVLLAVGVVATVAAQALVAA